MRQAAAHISDSEKLVHFEHYLSHNELGLALDELEAAGNKARVDEHFWWFLKKNAQVMGLGGHRLRFMRKVQKCRQEKSTP
jgi:hypothetical protein